MCTFVVSSWLSTYVDIKYMSVSWIENKPFRCNYINKTWYPHWNGWDFDSREDAKHNQAQRWVSIIWNSKFLYAVERNKDWNYRNRMYTKVFLQDMRRHHLFSRCTAQCLYTLMNYIFTVNNAYLSRAIPLERFKWMQDRKN